MIAGIVKKPKLAFQALNLAVKLLKKPTILELNRCSCK